MTATRRIKTCENCVRCKIRCSRNLQRDECDRCYRLGKECFFRPAVSHRAPAKRTSRIGDLETKLDKLLTTISHPDSKHLDACLEPVEQTSNTVPFDQASALVAHFQGSMTLHFPFVCFPPGTLLDETRQSETLLLLVILAAAAYENPARQGALVQKVQTAINKLLHSDAMFTVKMLQALLIHVAWCHCHSGPERYSVYLHLAISIVDQRKIDQPKQLCTFRPRMAIDPKQGFSPEDQSEAAEQRALIGCYYFSSSLGVLLQKKSKFPYSSFIEECAESLAQNAEFPTDHLLGHITRFQHLLEQADALSILNSPHLHASDDSDLRSSVQTLRERVRICKSSIPPDLTENYLLVLQKYTVELHICQISLFDRPSDSKLPPPVWSDFRIQALLDGLTVANQMFMYMKYIDPQIQRASNHTEWLQIGYFIVVSCKLAVASCELPVFHCTQLLREELNIPMMLDLATERMKALAVPGDPSPQQGHNDAPFSHMAWLKPIQDWFNRHYAPNEPAQVGEMGHGSHDLIGPNNTLTFDMEEDSDYLASANWYDFQWTNFFPWSIDDRLHEWA